MKGSTLKLNDKEVNIHGLEFQENRYLYFSS